MYSCHSSTLKKLTVFIYTNCQRKLPIRGNVLFLNIPGPYGISYTRLVLPDSVISLNWSEKKISDFGLIFNDTGR